MKKLTTLLFVLVFASSMAFAQSNDSDVNQQGDDNSATVQQLGISNSVGLDQGVFDGYDSNIAEINQNGEENSLAGYSHGDAVQGKDNYLKLDQDGDYNEAGVYQDFANSEAFIKQNGYENDAFVKQDAPKSYADVDQVGDLNTADINQNGTHPENENEAKVWQDGDFNTTNIGQLGDQNSAKHWVYGDDNMMNIDQTGYDNEAFVDQKNWEHNGNNYNEITVSQTNNSGGMGNEFFAKLKGDDNDVNITQNGSWNRVQGLTGYWNYGNMGAAFKYEGDNSNIDMTQEGNQNVVFAEIHNSNGDIDVEQYNNVNQAHIDIAGPSGGLLSGNSVDITQTSTGSDFTQSNYVDVTQRSDNNSAAVNQNGFDNTSTITQN